MAAKRAPVRSARARRPRSSGTEQELRAILIRMNYEGLKALRQLALDKDRTLQSLGIEAFNDLLRKYSVRPVLENPLLRTRVE